MNYQKDYAETLESYLIPAEEGFLFTQITEENINKLGEKRTLVVFTTDDSITFGGINYKKYTTTYNFSKAIDFPIMKYLKSRICENVKCPTFDLKLKSLLDNSKDIKIGDNTTVGDTIKSILKICDEYSKNNNILIIAYLTDSIKFSYSFMRDYPIIIAQSAIMKSVAHGLIRNNSITIKQLKKNYKDFEILNKKIPRSLYVKDMKFDLFHISPNGNIKELTPRITNKPMITENIGVARVSAAPSVDACFRAIGIGAVEREKDKKKKYYVYKLKLNKNMRIVKPTQQLVPDQTFTNEYWILDPVPVELLGTITVSVDEKNDKLVFDTSDMPEDPMITTNWKRVKK